MVDTTPLTSALEDYLEAICQVAAEKGAARVRDIAAGLSVHKSTVTSALRGLAEKNLINYRPYGLITPTDRGQRLAGQILHRHQVLQQFLREVLAVEEQMAEANACRMEHVLDEEILRRLSLFMEFLGEQPDTQREWLLRCQSHFKDNPRIRKDAKGVKLDANDKQEYDPKNGPRKEEGKILTLDRLAPGQKARIQRITGGAGMIRRRIVDMGLVPGTLLDVVKVAPLGDPMEVKLKGYNLSLRKKEAAAIVVEPQPQ